MSRHGSSPASGVRREILAYRFVRRKLLADHVEDPSAVGPVFETGLRFLARLDLLRQATAAEQLVRKAALRDRIARIRLFLDLPVDQAHRCVERRHGPEGRRRVLHDSRLRVGRHRFGVSYRTSRGELSGGGRVDRINARALLGDRLVTRPGNPQSHRADENHRDAASRLPVP